MPRRPSPAFTSMVHVTWIGALLVVAAACNSIGLSSDGAFVEAPGPSGHPDASPLDAGTVPPLVDGAETVVDAATASTSVGNPLCFFNFQDGGEHNCEPDTSGQCEQSTADDGGAYTGSWGDAAAVPVDAGAGDAGPSTGGDGYAPVQSACHVVPKGQMCTVAGPGGDGAQCQVSTDCAADFECVGSPGQCRHYCCGGNASCTAASDVTTGTTFCDLQPTTQGGLSVPVCEPVTSCTLLLTGTGNGSCPSGETCAVVMDDGTTSCVEIGPVGVGGDCETAHCANGLTCLGSEGNRLCFQLCQVDSPATCPRDTMCTSSAQLFTNANVGICQ